MDGSGLLVMRCRMVLGIEITHALLACFPKNANLILLHSVSNAMGSHDLVCSKVIGFHWSWGLLAPHCLKAKIICYRSKKADNLGMRIVK